MIKRVFVPITRLEPSGEEVTLTVVAAGTAPKSRVVTTSRDKAIRQARKELERRYGSVVFKASGKRDESMRWLDFEVNGKEAP